jgi:DNA-binding MurR/RpiR family transcriptional regulator
LPRIQKSLIQRILEEYEEYVFSTVDRAAQRLGVHKSTLVRLAQSLGYSGYTDLRGELQSLFRTEIAPGRKLGRTLSEIDIETVYPRVVETEILYLRESLKTVSSEEINEASRLIATARKVFVCGRGPQGPLARLLAFRLRRFHIDVVTIEEEGRAILEKLQLLTSDDVLILFSFIVVSPEQQHAISLARRLGSPTILVTDSVAREVLKDVTVTIAARRGPATLYHTDIVPIAIMTAILLDVAKQRAGEVLPGLEYLQQLRREFGYDYSVTPLPKDENSLL